MGGFSEVFPHTSVTLERSACVCIKCVYYMLTERQSLVTIGKWNNPTKHTLKHLRAVSEALGRSRRPQYQW